MKDIEERKRKQFATRYGCLKPLAKTFPDVKSIRISYEAVSESWDGTRTNGSLTISPEQLLDSLIRCPNGTCTSIGFDLNSDIMSLIERRQAYASGFKMCEGWEDAERYGVYKCGSIIKYELFIGYRKNTP